MPSLAIPLRPLRHLVIAAITLSGCAAPVAMTTIAPSTLRPIAVLADSAQVVGIASIRTALIPGTNIGGHHDGLLQIRQSTYYAQGVVSEQMEGAYRAVLEEELRSAGYPTLKSSGTSVFGEEVDESWKAQLLVGGTITSATLNSYAPLAGNKTEASCTVRWEILDRRTRLVTYTATTVGTAISPGVNIDAVVGALRGSFRELLADRRLVVALSRKNAEPQAVPNPPRTISIVRQSVALTSATTADLVRRAAPCVVAIRSPQGHGSGIVIDPSGLILTNYHVVEGSAALTVRLFDGSERNAQVVSVAAESDVALLQTEVPIEGCNGLQLRLDSGATVGEDVIAVGAPLSLVLSHTVSKGIVSGVRSVEGRHLIQTDVAINPGNSGGPLIDSTGRVIGIVSMKLSASGIEGLGFAIPIGEALTALRVLVQDSKTR